MSTATVLYDPNESIDNVPEYNIPESVSVDSSEGSVDDKHSDESTLSSGDEAGSASPLVFLPPMSPLKGKYILLQLWEGRVVEVRKKEFDAIIVDKTNPDYSDEFVTIDIMEISPYDLGLLRNGAVFYWSIGYSNYPGRGRVRESKIRFRRLKGWTRKEIDHSKIVGKNLAEFFQSNQSCSPSK